MVLNIIVWNRLLNIFVCKYGLKSKISPEQVLHTGNERKKKCVTLTLLYLHSLQIKEKILPKFLTQSLKR